MPRLDEKTKSALDIKPTNVQNKEEEDGKINAYLHTPPQSPNLVRGTDDGPAEVTEGKSLLAALRDPNLEERLQALLDDLDAQKIDEDRLRARICEMEDDLVAQRKARAENLRKVVDYVISWNRATAGASSMHSSAWYVLRNLLTTGSDFGDEFLVNNDLQISHIIPHEDEEEGDEAEDAGRTIASPTVSRCSSTESLDSLEVLKKQKKRKPRKHSD